MTLSFLLTRYVGRLAAPISLAAEGVCTLENLTDSGEIDELAHELLWRPSHLPAREELLDPILHSAVSEHDANLGLPTTTSVDKAHLAKRIAEECIVVRYRDARETTRGESTTLNESPDDEDEYRDAIEGARAYSITQLVSLLISDNDPEYWGWNFAYPHGAESVQNSSDFVWNIAHAFRTASWGRQGVQPQLGEHPWLSEWTSWQGARAKLEDLSPLLCRASDFGYIEHLQYAGEALEAVSDTNDAKFKLVLLVSIFEMLLTRNPDSRRFNVEDSISRQFLLKTSVLLHRAGRTDLDMVKQNLRRLYDLRSAIAHGDFARITKILQVSKTRVDSRVANQVTLAYDYLRSTFREFLNDPQYARFLKDN